MAHECSSCNSPAALVCGGCHAAWYCSPNCQRTDWMARHKVACKGKVSSLPPSSPPTPTPASALVSAVRECGKDAEAAETAIYALSEFLLGSPGAPVAWAKMGTPLRGAFEERKASLLTADATEALLGCLAAHLYTPTGLDCAEDALESVSTLLVGAAEAQWGAMSDTVVSAGLAPLLLRSLARHPICLHVNALLFIASACMAKDGLSGGALRGALLAGGAVQAVCTLAASVNEDDEYQGTEEEEGECDLDAVCALLITLGLSKREAVAALKSAGCSLYVRRTLSTSFSCTDTRRRLFWSIAQRVWYPSTAGLFGGLF